MTALNKHAELRQLAEKATRGEWWSDVVETDGEYGDGEDRASGYHSYAVYVGSELLLDMTNSTAACIHEEWDHDYHMAWDETAKRNAEFISAANPATVLALLDELEAAEKRIAEQQSAIIAPGIMRCAGCGFVLTKNSINMVAGTITAGDSKTEPCPNGCGPLWPVTWKEQAIQMRDDSEQWFLELQQAKNRIAELEAREIKPAKGEVLVVISGFTGCGKSAIAGEIEIAMKAIGVSVQWTNGDAEKRMTGADWLTAIEMYKPTVRIVEVNVPRSAGIGVKGE